MLLNSIAGLVRTPDTGTRMLLLGLWGLLAILAVDWATLTFAFHHEPIRALREAVGVIATVGLGDEAPPGRAYAVFSSVAMLLTIVLTALFTAGVVERVLGPRLSGIIGPRVLPRRGHVIVVGLGQVGLRLCRELIDLGVPVVGVERDPDAANLRLIRALRIPAVMGHGGDRTLLTRLGAEHARAIAAVGSDDLDNIAVALAVRAVARNARLVLRAGEHEGIADTASLLRMGALRDLAAITTAYVVVVLLGGRPVGVVNTGPDTFIRTPDGRFRHVDEVFRSDGPAIGADSGSGRPAD
ncbi:NAD-binding protein [Tsukamurella soli]